jgi:hypothetical protein
MSRITGSRSEQEVTEAEFDAELHAAMRTPSIKGWLCDPFLKKYFEVNLPITKTVTPEADGTVEYTVSSSHIKMAMRIPETTGVTDSKSFHLELLNTQYLKVYQAEYTDESPEMGVIECERGIRSYNNRVLYVNERSIYRGSSDKHMLVNKSFTHSDWVKARPYFRQQIAKQGYTERTRMLMDVMTWGCGGVYPDTCASCGKTQDLQQCSRCKTVSYCGGECQNADWRRHKILCLK